MFLKCILCRTIGKFLSDEMMKVGCLYCKYRKKPSQLERLSEKTPKGDATV